MGRWGRLGRALALVLAALVAGGALVFAVGQARGGWLLLGAAFAHSPAATLYALNSEAMQKNQNSPNSLAVRGPWQGQNSGNHPGGAGAATTAPTPSPTPVASPAATPAPTATPRPTPTATPYLGDTTGFGRISARFFGQGSGAGYIQLAAGSIKNATDHTDAELAAAAAGALPFAVELNSEEPQVLILHTHATETYQPWNDLYFDPSFTARTQDTTQNMCAVGAQMAKILNDAGINTLHDATLHDDPSYTESYARSRQTAQNYLETYPSIKIVLDVHRDAVEQEGVRIKPLAEVDGADTAQVMLICGCNNGNTVRLPNWRQNLKFAAAWEGAMEGRYPGLTRPVLCGYRFYNQDLSVGSLLIEVGGHGNTLAEALRGGGYAATALAALLTEQAE
ncbi:MAG: stage II sporulation protein P [Gemmiger sp.]|nr:stage II sporulation protein P [Gemmiger sp.]